MEEDDDDDDDDFEKYSNIKCHDKCVQWEMTD
jgi:hypothetical protein